MDWITVPHDNVQLRVLVVIDSWLCNITKETNNWNDFRRKIDWRVKLGKLPDSMCARKCFLNSRKWLYKAECFITLAGNCTLCALRVSLFYFSLSLTSRNPAKDFHFFLRGFARLTKLWKQLGVHFEKPFFLPPPQTFYLRRSVLEGGGRESSYIIWYKERSLLFPGIWRKLRFFCFESSAHARQLSIETLGQTTPLCSTSWHNSVVFCGMVLPDCYENEIINSWKHNAVHLHERYKTVNFVCTLYLCVPCAILTANGS